MATATTFEETKNNDSSMTMGSVLEVVPEFGSRGLLEAQGASFAAFGMSSDSTNLGYGLDRRVAQRFSTDPQLNANAVEWRFDLRRGGGDTDDTSRFFTIGATESGHTTHEPLDILARLIEGIVISEIKAPTSDWLSKVNRDRVPLHDATLAFSEGFDGVRPSPNTLENAERLVRAAIAKCARADIDVDDNTGSLAFDLRLSDGALLFAEVEISGKLNADMFNDEGEEAVWLKHFPNPSFSDLIGMF